MITQFINLSDERIEIIVIDDGSTDNTPKLKEEFKFKNFNYFKIKNSERGFARNYGVSKSSGKYINFFDLMIPPIIILNLPKKLFVNINMMYFTHHMLYKKKIGL